MRRRRGLEPRLASGVAHLPDASWCELGTRAPTRALTYALHARVRATRRRITGELDQNVYDTGPEQRSPPTSIALSDDPSDPEVGGAPSELGWRCRNRHWDEAVLSGPLYWSGGGHPLPRECHPAKHDTPTFVAISHHKSGTGAAFNVMMTLCCPEARNIANANQFMHLWGYTAHGGSGFDLRYNGTCADRCAGQRAFLAQGGLSRVVDDAMWGGRDDHSQELCSALPDPTLPSLHFVRNPFEMVVSGYLYTLDCPEPWMRVTYPRANFSEGSATSAVSATMRFGSLQNFTDILGALNETMETYQVRAARVRLG